MEVYICEQETPRIEFSRENDKLFDFSDHPNSSSAKIQGGRVGSAAEGTGKVGYVQCRAQVGLGSGTAIQTSLMKLERCNARATFTTTDSLSSTAVLPARICGMVQLYGGTGQRQIKNICGEESTTAVIGQTTASCTARTNGGQETYS